MHIAHTNTYAHVVLHLLYKHVHRGGATETWRQVGAQDTSECFQKLNIEKLIFIENKLSRSIGLTTFFLIKLPLPLTFFLTTLKRISVLYLYDRRPVVCIASYFIVNEYRLCQKIMALESSVSQVPY